MQDADSDVRHIILDFGESPFPVLEGQSIGIVRARDRCQRQAAPRRGFIRWPVPATARSQRQQSGANGKARDRAACARIISAICRAAPRLEVTGPFGATFLMPNDPAANIVMICTGTGSAPFRGFTERRRRAMPDAAGRLLLFFGARRPEELPYFGPLQKVPEKLLGQVFLLFAGAEPAPRLCTGPHPRRGPTDVATARDPQRTSISAG